MRIPPCATAAVCGVALLLAGGCSGGGPRTYTATGQVTYQGKPVADAQIGFVPADGNSEAKPARGQTDAEGRFTLSTYLGPGDDAHGAMAGSYKVTVAKGLPQNQVVTYEELQNFKSEIPVVYADSAKTPLTAEVTAAGDNQFNFTLEGQ